MRETARLRRSLWIAPLLMGSLAFATTAQAAPSAATSHLRVVDGHKVGLGKILTTSDGGQIFGWDINEHGRDGVLATSQTADTGYTVSVQTFDQRTAEITHTFATYTGPRDSYSVDGILAGDRGLITHFVVPRGSIYAKRFYDVMDPVTAQDFTGTWTPPVKDFDVIANADNQETKKSVLYGIRLQHGSAPGLAVTNLARGTSSFIPLDSETYKLGSAQMAMDTTNNQAVLAASNGTVGPGRLPTIAQVDLRTGHVTEWQGIAEGPFGAGFINGLAVDGGTGIFATTTELNAQVEFYDLATRTGFAVQLPGTGPADQLNSGAFVTVDPVNHLFLVSDPLYAPTGDGAVVVYKENGDLVEAITGFHFGGLAQGPQRLAVNPATRTGYVDGPGIDQLQQFFY
jgi:hypothetical protein